MIISKILPAALSILVATAAAILITSDSLFADAVVVTKAMSASTIAEFFVEDDSVRVELEIGGADIAVFKNLLPDEIYSKFEFGDSDPAEQRIDHFFASDFPITVDGRALPGRVVALSARKRIQRDEITGKPLALQPDDAEIVIYAQLIYKLDGQPKSISVQPLLDPEQKQVAANIGFITYHRGLPVMDFRYLSSEETLDLDWQDPWYSKFRNKNLHRQYDAPLSAFLYVEPFEVRVEVVVRPVDLQRWTGLGVTTNQIIPVSDQAELKSLVADFLKDKIAVTINGELAAGRFDRIHFISRTLRKTGVVYPDRDLHASSATLGVIFVYPVTQLPKTVTMKWNLFDDRIQSIPSVATDEAGGLPWTLTAEDPVLEWKNFPTNPTIPAMLAIDSPPARPQVSLPLASLGLLVVATLALFQMIYRNFWKRRTVAFTLVVLSIGGAVLFWPHARIQFANPIVSQHQVTEQQATEVTRSLMHNLYRSFDRRDESVIYDQLATCIAGDLLRDIYVQMMQSIRLEDQGGAQMKINDIDLLESAIVLRDDSPGFDSRVKWNVLGPSDIGAICTRAPINTKPSLGSSRSTAPGRSFRCRSQMRPRLKAIQ